MQCSFCLLSFRKGRRKQSVRTVAANSYRSMLVATVLIIGLTVRMMVTMILVMMRIIIVVVTVAKTVIVPRLW